MNRWKALLMVGVIAGAGVVATGCGECPANFYCSDGVQTPLPRPTPAPAFAGNPWDRPWTDVEAYAATLQFDSMHTAGHGEYLPLGTPPGPLTLGPYATFYPEIGAGRKDSAAVARGRIIARVELSAEYLPMRLPAGVSYLWHDGVGGGRLVWLSANMRTLRARVFQATVATAYEQPCSIQSFSNLKLLRAGGVLICTCCPSGGYCEDGPVIDSIM